MGQDAISGHLEKSYLEADFVAFVNGIIILLVAIYWLPTHHFACRDLLASDTKKKGATRDRKRFKVHKKGTYSKPILLYLLM